MQLKEGEGERRGEWKPSENGRADEVGLRLELELEPERRGWAKRVERRECGWVM